jgi:hypothetical protein
MKSFACDFGSDGGEENEFASIDKLSRIRLNHWVEKKMNITWWMAAMAEWSQLKLLLMS